MLLQNGLYYCLPTVDIGWSVKRSSSCDVIPLNGSVTKSSARGPVLSGNEPKSH